jgi:hypothetical protein
LQWSGKASRLLARPSQHQGCCLETMPLASADGLGLRRVGRASMLDRLLTKQPSWVSVAARSCEIYVAGEDRIVDNYVVITSSGYEHPNAPVFGVMSALAFDPVLPAAGSEVELAAELLNGTGTFRGRWATPGLNCALPVQTFTQTISRNEVKIRSISEGKLPLVEIDLVSDNGSNIAACKRFKAQPVDDSVEAYLLATRLMFCWGYARSLQLIGDRGVLVELHLDDEYDTLKLHPLSTVVRKLRYIERYLDIGFEIPNVFDSPSLLDTEIVFRAITEGEFVIRGDTYEVPQMELGAIQLSGPPFTGPGPLYLTAAGNQSETAFKLLGKDLYLGPYTTTLPMAEISDPSVLDSATAKQTPVDISFALLDHQVRYRFEDYVGLIEAGQQKLASFKHDLAKDEPVELVNLVDESVQADVTSHEAISIGNGWLQFNDFPDAYSAWWPIVDEIESTWKIPIHLAYPSGKGGPVGELVIDAKTGVVRHHTEIATIRARGRELAEKILDAG